MSRLKNWIRWSWKEGGFHGIVRFAHRAWMRIRNAGAFKAEEQQRKRMNELYPSWYDDGLPDEDERARQAETVFSHKLTFLIPTWNTRRDLLLALAASLKNQTNASWEACFFDGDSSLEATRETLREIEQSDARFHVSFGDENLGISGNTNQALEMAQMSYCALCDHDDLLAPDAVYCILMAAEQGADMIYSDEDKVDETATRYYDPHLKGDYAPDTLRSGNYICHILAAKTELLRRVGGLRSDCDGSQDHDLALRLAVCADRIVHIPRILYHWRMLSTSVSHEAIERCVDASVRAVQNQLNILGIPGKVFRENMQPRILYRLPREVKISLIFQGNQKQLQRLKKHTDFKFTETLLAASEGLNEAAETAAGTYLVFAAGDVIPQSGTWINEMLMYAQRNDVACVGAPLVSRRGVYLHAGYAMDVPGGAISYHHGSTMWGRPYQLMDRIVRNVTGVSSAWMMIRRDVFLELGGFGAFASDLRGAVLGWQALQAGYVNVITPYARAVIRKDPPCLTGTAPEHDLELLDAMGPVTERYYSPLFERQKGTMTPDFEKYIPPYEGELL